jgi:tRNA threonylcarbamoyladenosine biosynthesis protein TsaB
VPHSTGPTPPASRPAGPLLAVDAASPITSVAVGRGGALPAVRSDRAPSSATLMRQIDECLAEAGLRPADLTGLVALRGPGSFTGLRVGLATVLGLRNALDLPAATFTNLEAMAAAAMLAEPPGAGRLLAVADALRGQWLCQLFAAEWPPRPLAAARLATPKEIAELAPDRVVGFDLSQLSSQPGWEPALATAEAGALAPVALRLAASSDWDAAGLTAPVYLRPAIASSVATPGSGAAPPTSR